MKQRISLIALAVCSIPAYAIIPNTDVPALDLPAYYAEPGQPPSFAERFASTFQHFYLTPKIGVGNISVTDISNVSNAPPGTILPTVATDSFSSSAAQYGVGVGYHFRPTGIFDRFELEYMYHKSIDYNSSPAVVFPFPPPTDVASLTSTNNFQTLLLKTYWDINVTPWFIPFLQVGAGASLNQTDFTGTYIPVFNPPTFSNSGSHSTYDFAFDAGAGLRFKLNPHWYIDAGYEFVYFGNKDLNWTIQTNDPNMPIELESGTAYSNSFVFGITGEV